MTQFFLWAGIGLIVFGWLLLAWQASRRMMLKDEIEKSQCLKGAMRRRRNYCLLMILAGAVMTALAAVI